MADKVSIADVYLTVHGGRDRNGKKVEPAEAAARAELVRRFPLLASASPEAIVLAMHSVVKFPARVADRALGGEYDELDARISNGDGAEEAPAASTKTEPKKVEKPAPKKDDKKKTAPAPKPPAEEDEETTPAPKPGKKTAPKKGGAKANTEEEEDDVTGLLEDEDEGDGDSGGDEDDDE